VAPNRSPSSNNNKKIFLNSATNNGFLRVLSANNSPTGVTENSNDTPRKNSSTSEKNDEELQQLLGICGDGGFRGDPEAQQKQELRITENPLLKRNPAGSPISVALSDISSGLTQPTMTTVIRYEEPTPVLDSARGCWLSKRKANPTTRTSLERYVVIVVILLLIACLGFLIFGYLLRPDCSDGKAWHHISGFRIKWAVTLKRILQFISRAVKIIQSNGTEGDTKLRRNR
jgi:hypothetical protein